MPKRVIVLTSSIFLASACFVPAVHAKTVDTVSFSTTGWTREPFTQFYGQFSGTVEPDGLIELNDLTAFQAIAVVGALNVDFSGVGALSLFSFDITGGASSLAIIAANPSDLTTACVGAPSTLSPICNIGGNNPVSTLAVIDFNNLPFDLTPDPPTVAVVSSVTIVPEPSTWTMMLVAFASLAQAKWRRRRKAPERTIRLAHS
jgi:PEP-CTERM motif